MPGRELLHVADWLEAEATVVRPPGIDVPPRPPGARASGPLRILWAARWEHDKDPDAFFAALQEAEKARRGLPHQRSRRVIRHGARMLRDRPRTLRRTHRRLGLCRRPDGLPRHPAPGRRVRVHRPPRVLRSGRHRGGYGGLLSRAAAPAGLPGGVRGRPPISTTAARPRRWRIGWRSWRANWRRIRRRRCGPFPGRWPATPGPRRRRLWTTASPRAAEKSEGTFLRSAPVGPIHRSPTGSAAAAACSAAASRPRTGSSTHVRFRAQCRPVRKAAASSRVIE